MPSKSTGKKKWEFLYHERTLYTYLDGIIKKVELTAWFYRLGDLLVDTGQNTLSSRLLNEVDFIITPLVFNIVYISRCWQRHVKAPLP